jgi:hypothetical protein
VSRVGSGRCLLVSRIEASGTYSGCEWERVLPTGEYSRVETAKLGGIWTILSDNVKEITESSMESL